MSGHKVEQAIDLVKALIQSGKLRAGDRLPNEADLSAQLGVSRNSLREAVRAMQTMKILEARQGDGTYVSDLNPAMMMDVLSFAVDVSDAQAVVYYLELRRTLEVAAVEVAAARRTEAQLDRLKHIHSFLYGTTAAEDVLALDASFHECIAEIGGNPVHAALLRVVSAPTLRARISRQREIEGVFTRVHTEHQAILDAIEAKDVEAARFAMWSHVNQVVHWVKENSRTLESSNESSDAAE